MCLAYQEQKNVSKGK